MTDLGTTADRAAIDDLVRRFFAAFTNKDDAAPNVDDLTALFMPSGVIVKAVGVETEVYSVQSFIVPRRRILADGTLRDFSEEETDARTDIAGNIAQRISLYRKSGVMAGERFEAKGIKVMQFVRMPNGWRISAVSWDDEREGLTIPGAL
jgi:hypothetical protein